MMRAGFPGRRSPVAKLCSSAWSRERRVNMVVVPLNVSVSLERNEYEINKQAGKTLSEGLADYLPIRTAASDLKIMK